MRRGNQIARQGALDEIEWTAVVRLAAIQIKEVGAGRVLQYSGDGEGAAEVVVGVEDLLGEDAAAAGSGSASRQTPPVRGRSQALPGLLAIPVEEVGGGAAGAGTLVEVPIECRCHSQTGRRAAAARGRPQSGPGGRGS